MASFSSQNGQGHKFDKWTLLFRDPRAARLDLSATHLATTKARVIPAVGPRKFELYISLIFSLSLIDLAIIDMSLVTITFNKRFKGKKSYTAACDDAWRYNAVVNRNPNSEKKYSHSLTLVSRSDGQDVPIEAVYRNDHPDCMIREFFTVGQTVVIFSNKEDLQIIYFANPPGSLAFDLITYSASEENFELKSSDGKSFFINESLFKSRSKVFRAMLAHDTKEAQEKKIEFKDLSSSVLEDLVNFLKTDKIIDLSKNALALGFVADKFDLRKLLSLVQSYLESNVTEENYEKVSQLAVLTKSSILWTALAKASLRKRKRD